jgi:hypothetical protein
MDKAQAVAKARQFAETAHSVALDKLSRQFQEKLKESRAQMAANGNLLSGGMIKETARITAERITALLQSRLDCLLEGFELHHVTLDDELVVNITNELTALRSSWIEHAGQAIRSDPVVKTFSVAESTYLQMIGQDIGLHPNEIRTQIDRRRFMPKKTEAGTSINIYHVIGHNNRWVTNSQDHSVNVVSQPSSQIFASLRQTIESGAPLGEEQTDILKRLAALEKAESTSSFKERYTEFIDSAANYMTLVAPFIPALTEMLQKALKL